MKWFFVFLQISIVVFMTAVYANDAPSMEQSTVSVPWTDFKEILTKLRKDTIHTSTEISPPASYVVTSLQFEGNPVNEQQCMFLGHMRISVLKDGWVTVPFMNGVALDPDVKVSDRSVLDGKCSYDGGSNILLFNKKGVYEITFRFTVPIQNADGISHVVFPVPATTIAAVAIELDHDDYVVRANKRRLSLNPDSRNRFVYKGAVGSKRTVVIDWQQPMARSGIGKSMVVGKTNTMYSIGMGTIQVSSNVHLTVYHQDIAQFTFSLPSQVEVIDITGPAVTAWEVVDTESVKKTSVYFKYNIRETTSFTLTAEKPYQDSTSHVALPALLLDNTDRQEGFIGVGVLSNVELNPGDQSTNVLRKDKRELPTWFGDAGDILYAYQYLSANYRVAFKLKPHRNVSSLPALIENVASRSVLRNDGKTITELKMEVKNRGEQFIHLDWDFDDQVWSLFCNGKPARPSYDSTTDELLIPLVKSSDASAKTVVELVYLSMNQKFRFAGYTSLRLPSSNIPMQSVDATLFIPDNYKPFWFKGNIQPGDQHKDRWFGSVFGVILETVFNYNLPALNYRGNRSERIIADKCVEIVEAVAPPPSPPPQNAFRMAEKQQADAPMPQEPGIVGAGESILHSGSLGVSKLQMQSQPSVAKPMEAPHLADFESGLLSIPVTVTYDGRPYHFKTPLLNKGDAPEVSFLYRSVFMQPPGLIVAVIAIVLLIIGGIITKGLWSGWSLRMLFYDILLPLSIVLFVGRIIGYPIPIDVIVIPPLLFFTIKALLVVLHLFSEKRNRKIATDTGSDMISGQSIDANNEKDDESADDISLADKEPW